MSRSKGFTLIELLIALTLFAIVSAFAYRSLDALLQSRQALQKESRKWRDVALFVGRVDRDLRALLERTATSGTGAALPALSSSIEVAAAQSTGLSLTRSGSALQANALAAPQRVAYRLRDGRIERLAWASVDAAPREEPVATDVLGDVRALEFRFLAGNEWRTAWGPAGSGERPPAAVEMTLTLASGERIVRVIDLPRHG